MIGTGYWFCSFVPPFRVSVPALRRPAVGQSEEEEPVPFAARYFLGDGGQGFVSTPLELEPVVEDLDNDVAALEIPGEQRAGKGQPRIARGGDMADRGPCPHFRGARLDRVAGSADSEVCVIGQLLGAPTGPFGKVAFGQDLDAPGDAFAQELLVVGSRLLTEHIEILLSKLADRHPGEPLDFLICGCFHPKPPWFTFHPSRAVLPHRNLGALTRE